jgi:hypothetical protein
MPEMDQGIKRLIQRHPADVLKLALPDADFLGILPTELVTEPQRVLDVLARVRYHGVECAADVEVEARPRPEIARRLFEYGARTATNTRLPVLSIVLWLEAGGAPPASPYVMRAGDETLATWRFVGVELYRLSADQLIEPGLLGLLPLVPFSRDGLDIAVIERAGQIVKERAPIEELGEMETLLAIFGARTFGADVMRAMLRRLAMSTEILDTSPLYQEWKREWQEQGMQQGIEQGMRQGVEQGMRQGVRQALALVLRGRFGALPEPLAQAIEAAPMERIDEALTRAATASLDELAALLGEQPAS